MSDVQIHRPEFTASGLPELSSIYFTLLNASLTEDDYFTAANNTSTDRAHAYRNHDDGTFYVIVTRDDTSWDSDGDDWVATGFTNLDEARTYANQAVTREAL